MSRLLQVVVRRHDNCETWATFDEQPDGTWKDDDGDVVRAKDGSANFFKFLVEEFEVIRKDEGFWS